MDSYPDVLEHESRAKRIKLDFSGGDIGELCNGDGFSCFSATISGPIDISEGVSADCDSGYEASNLESISTPTHNHSHHTSPHTDPGDLQESLSSLSESFLQTPTHTADQLDTSQDSLEADDDNASTVSHLSELSGLSDLSGQEWKPMAGSMIWIQQQMQKGVNPRNLLTELGVDLDQIPQYVDDLTLWKIIINMLAEPPRRNKLRHVNTLDDVVRLLKGAQNIIVLTGAGVSVSCGIPDFRSRDGIYSRLAMDFPNLPDPQAMFDISFFSQDPRPFFKFARDIYPGKFKPSPCHRFIRLLEKHKKLLRNYTQNIDTLEKEADIQKVIECHGSFATATCTKCSHKVTADRIRDIVLAQKIPLCEVCHAGQGPSVSTDDLSSETTDYRDLVMSGIMKPDIVFFGEGLPDTFHEAMAEDKSQCDLLLVIGSSLKVRPVALIPSSLPSHVPQILINREPLPHCRFDVELMGDCDVVINHLCRLLSSNWEEGIYNSQVLKESSHLLPHTTTPPALPHIKPKNHIQIADCSQTTCSCLCSGSSTNVDVKRSSNHLTNSCSSCKCQSITTTHVDSDDYVKNGKERHISIDSAKDSGIGENSNFTDIEVETRNEEGSSFQLELTSEPHCSFKSVTDSFRSGDTDSFKGPANCFGKETKESPTDLRGFWQPKIKKSLADRLPNDSFYLIPPSRYIFPGAEVFYDPDEKSSDHDNSDADTSDNDSTVGVGI